MEETPARQTTPGAQAGLSDTITEAEMQDVAESIDQAMATDEGWQTVGGS
jgi:hypothetical protein